MFLVNETNKTRKINVLLNWQKMYFQLKKIAFLNQRLAFAYKRLARLTEPSWNLSGWRGTVYNYVFVPRTADWQPAPDITISPNVKDGLITYQPRRAAARRLITGNRLC